MNQQDVLKRVNLVDVIKSISGGLKSALILVGMLAALLVILITAVSLQQSTNSPASAAPAFAGETVYTNPELNIVAKYAGASAAEKAHAAFHTNPELKVVESFAGVNGATGTRNMLAVNPELKSFESAAGFSESRNALAVNPELKVQAGATSISSRDVLATNPEVGTFLRYQD